MKVADWPQLGTVLRICSKVMSGCSGYNQGQHRVHTSHALEVSLVSCSAVPLTKLQCKQSPCPAEGCAPRNGKSSSQADLDHVDYIVAEPLRPFLSLQHSPQKALK